MSAAGHRAIRAPREDGALVADPTLSEVGALLEANLERQRRPLLLLGRPLADLQAEARQTALEAARSYLARLGEPIPDGPTTGPLLLAGHQPELFHPGVWVKNFALHGLARAHGGIALNLIVDNDTVKSTLLRLPHPPTQERPSPYLVRVPFDHWSGEVPFEEWTIHDRDLFRSFADRAGAVLQGWDYQPMLPAFWDEVCRRAGTDPHPGTCFVSARRDLERRWGCHNRELPLSALCASEAFAWFACDLLARLPAFHRIYNRCLVEYRKANRIRSRNHPVPELKVAGDFLEAPLWGWRAGQGRRGRLMVRQRGDRLELRAGDDSWPDLPKPEEGRMPQVLQAWHDLQAAGYRIRTRALSTTLFSRLLLADLFMHGIGGGKYDELTDQIARQFYERELPGYLVLSATRLLPLPAYPCTIEDRRRLLRTLRDFRYNPDRFLEGVGGEGLQPLIAEKHAWVNQTPRTPAEYRERFLQLRAVNAWLHEPLQGREQELRQRLETCDRELAANALLQRRDYAFCLYPEEVLRPFCTRLLVLP